MNKRTYIIFLLVGVSLMYGVTSVQAKSSNADQDAAVRARQEAVQQKELEARQRIRLNPPSPMQDPNNPIAVAARTRKRKQSILALQESYTKRLLNYRRFLAKVQSRRAKLAADQKDVTKLDAFILTATQNLAEAEKALDVWKSALQNDQFTDETAKVKQALHRVIDPVHASFVKLERTMKSVVEEIKMETAARPKTNHPDTTDLKQQKAKNVRTPFRAQENNLPK